MAKDDSSLGKRKSRRRAALRTCLVQARVSPGELEAWRSNARAAGVSSSGLLRQAMTRTGRWTPAGAAVERERTREIARIGRNLNQIARWVNGHKAAADAVEVIVHLIAIDQAVLDLTRPNPPEG